MLPLPALDSTSEAPLYRQLYTNIRDLIESGVLGDGGRLPATRELAGQLGLNRATVSAAYDLLESEGLITGQVGRGSFVKARAVSGPETAGEGIISFANSRPSELLFPTEDFRESCQEVIRGDASAILQLGSPNGYGPLRRFLQETSRSAGVAKPSDDILVTSGCQQALDLLARVCVRHGDTVLCEDPVYHGLRKVFERSGARLLGVPMTERGIDLDQLERTLAREQPALLVVTPNFQNPSGASLPLTARLRLLEICRRHGTPLAENDIYGELDYEGSRPPELKALEGGEDVLLLRSFSKLAFPGLRVGWIIGPRPLLDKLAEAKQWSDLHTDQLSQAVLLRFAQSGRLGKHRERVLSAGRQRLRAALAACARYLPPGTEFTRPSGGMNVWVRLPYPLDAGELLPRAEREGVTYLPGRLFAVSRIENAALRLSFAGLTPEKIEAGIAILGRVCAAELEKLRSGSRFETAPAMV